MYLDIHKSIFLCSGVMPRTVVSLNRKCFRKHRKVKIAIAMPNKSFDITCMSSYFQLLINYVSRLPHTHKCIKLQQ